MKPSERKDYSRLITGAANDVVAGYKHDSVCLDCGKCRPHHPIDVITQHSGKRVNRLGNYYMEIVFECRCPCGGVILDSYFQRWSSNSDT